MKVSHETSINQVLSVWQMRFPEENAEKIDPEGQNPFFARAMQVE